MVDAPALWCKLRGEEQVFVSRTEKLGIEAGKRLSKLFARTNKSDPDEVAKYEREVEEFGLQYEKNQAQVQASYSSAGDKYRLTLVNLSSVRGWFNPSEAPASFKVLARFCEAGRVR